MKNFITIFLIALAMTAFNQSTNAQNFDIPNYSGDFVLMRVVETTTISLGGIKDEIILSDGTSDDPDRFRMKGGFTSKGNNNAPYITNTIIALRDQGYELESTVGGGASSQGVFIINYLWKKAE